MPRVRLDPDYWKLYGRDYIKARATQKRIADRLGISQQAVSKKMKTLDFTIEQFREIVNEIGMSDHAILTMMKGGT